MTRELGGLTRRRRFVRKAAVCSLAIGPVSVAMFAGAIPSLI